MSTPDHRRRFPLRATSIYLTVLFLALLIAGVGATIWLSTDNSGTNVLATDERAISRTP